MRAPAAGLAAVLAAGVAVSAWWPAAGSKAGGVGEWPRVVAPEIRVQHAAGRSLGRPVMATAARDVTPLPDAWFPEGTRFEVVGERPEGVVVRLPDGRAGVVLPDGLVLD